MKSRPSKLDRYAEQLAELEAEGKKLADMQAWLKAEGCPVSLGRLSDFLASARQERLHQTLFGMIATGARMNNELDAQFEKNPAPEIEQLIRVTKTLISSLQVQGVANPDLLELSNTMQKTVLDFAKLDLKREELALAQDKFEFNATREAMAKLDTLKAIKADSKLTEEEKMYQARMQLFGSAPE